MEILTDNEILAWLDVCNGYGTGYGDGTGYGYGTGYGDGTGYGYGYGYGDGTGNGDGTGYGYGNGDGTGISEYEGHKLYQIDHIPTAILAIHDNVAKGFILDYNVYKRECYIVKENGLFAHGDTLHDAFSALQEKLYDNSTEEERIKAFVNKFPLYDTKYPNEDLFTYHHVLTGSCRMGRENFCKNHNIDMNGKTSIREFIELTQNDYGGEIIRRLKDYYK